MAKFKGTESNDAFEGTDRDDVMRGFGGYDLLRGNDGDDRLFGGDGNDVLNGGAGTDFYSGGDGIDSLAFSSVSLGVPDLRHGVKVDMARGLVLDDGYGNVESLRSIERISVISNPFVDRLRGDETVNHFELGDRDRAFGAGGDDAFEYYGADGAVIDGGDGSDALVLEGFRRFLDPETGEITLQTADQGIVVDLARGVIENDGFGGHTDRVSGMETVTGFDHDDRLTGNDEDNLLFAGKGNDVLTGGRGKDDLYGELGHDTFVFAIGDSGATEDTADVIHTFAQRQGDRIDLSAVSAAIGHSLTFIGQGGFSGVGAEVRILVDDREGGNTLIEIDVDGGGDADLAIATGGGNIVYFTAADFVF